jgi:hypothetical protein
VAQRLAAEAARSDRAFKQVVNEALRRGLNLPGKRGSRAAYSVRPIRLAFRPGIDPDKLNQLVDELEIEAGVGKLLK